MSNEEYSLVVEPIKPSFLLFLIFLGWLGIDKFVYTKSFKKGWKFALVKFLYTCIGLGIIWNIFDIVQYCRHKYQLDFRDYFN